ncbi:hypothetical protein AK830_g10828 [Neonectria ditissima]|uniref:Uncharacterized protein n=1 Tax=Neonectria ditissima TaxID=78410 RepID=A0A0P7AES9_9HYPO|nr:hypothetical protein AK830_g10828 [Neonectria ditissima]
MPNLQPHHQPEPPATTNARRRHAPAHNYTARSRSSEGINAALPAPFQDGRQVRLTTWRGPRIRHEPAHGPGHALEAADGADAGGREVSIRRAHHGLYYGGTRLPNIPETAMQARSQLGFPTNTALQQARFGRRFIVIPLNHQDAETGSD